MKHKGTRQSTALWLAVALMLSVILSQSVFFTESQAAKSPALTNVVLNRETEKIGVRAFENARSLERVELPAGLKEISDKAFYNTGLSEISLPEGLTTIGPNAFYNAVHVSPLIVPDSLKTMEPKAYGYTAEGKRGGIAIICSESSPAKIYAAGNDIACFNRGVVGDTRANKEHTKRLLAGDVYSFTVNGLMSQAYYSTSNPAVATVSSRGKVEAVGAGTTAIIASSGSLNCILRVTVSGVRQLCGNRSICHHAGVLRPEGQDPRHLYQPVFSL